YYFVMPEKPGGTMTEKAIVGAGSALVDLLLKEKDEFVKNMGSEKGGMTLVNLDTIEKALEASSSSYELVPGGSACNTLVGIGTLGGKSRMIGKCGKDKLAEVFRNGIIKAGVEDILGVSDTPTGRVLSIVTPDAQRTMFTFLGAAAELSPQDIRSGHFENTAIVHLEGYQLFNREVTEAVIRETRNAQAQLSLDLASFEVVEASRSYLEKIIPEQVDILIANEDEARAYTGKSEEESLDIFSRMTDIAVVKLGGKGAVIARGNERCVLQAENVEVVDTTGAGDLWASGFLFGLTHGYSLEHAGRLAVRVASEVVQVMGAVIPSKGWERIYQFKRELENN
ncbi:adenosine kinase, partial [Fibrobacterota bacterium]